MLTVRAVALLLVAGLLGACGGTPPVEPGAPGSPATVVTLPEQSDAPGAAVATSGGEPERPKAPQPPVGYVEMTVVGVAPTGEGKAVLLVNEDKSVILPIFIGGTEALSIDLRHRRQRYQRPLTHDLLDEIMGELGGALVKVQVDALKGSTFVGSVFVRKGGRVVEIDARPSDAIALAVGNRVPIYVARAVLDEAGIKKSDLPTDHTKLPLPRI